ncbi:MAG: MarR family transcriptional regulator [Burkholderiales bacterium]|nr:MarR family transcriptional regulator [Burkholderiales bacterium]
MTKPFYSAADYRPGDSVGYLIRQLKSSLTRCIEAQIACHGLTDAQWGPMVLIKHRKDSNAAELAQALDVDTGAMTRTLDRLQAKGLIRRTRSQQDRRVVILELTEAGEQAVAKVPAAVAHANNLHLEGFSEVEFAQLRGFLLRMLDSGKRCQAQRPRAER